MPKVVWHPQVYSLGLVEDANNKAEEDGEGDITQEIQFIYWIICKLPNERQIILLINLDKSLSFFPIRPLLSKKKKKITTKLVLVRVLSASVANL